MEQLIAIQKLAEQMGLTSRTLRHWEAEGLLSSQRDPWSGWRSYDSLNVFRIKVTALLRSYDISLKDIKQVLDSSSCACLCAVIRRSLDELAAQRQESEALKKNLDALLSSLRGREDMKLTEETLKQMPAHLPCENSLDQEKEHQTMIHTHTGIPQVRFVTLPPMRAAYHIAVSLSPEEEALKTVTGWLKENHLQGTARIFGGDMPPMPSGEGKPYGYGVLASIPESFAVSSPLQEMNVPGGLYAVMESSDDIGGSWKKLMQYLKDHEEYEPDRLRPCFEEHIRNDAPEGSSHEYFLRLMEPVVRK